jgi:hypothetical protein
MSIPISWCQIYQAAKGDDSSFQFLVLAMEYNSTQMAYSTLACMCKPPCEPATTEQLKVLEKRVNDTLKKK